MGAEGVIAIIAGVLAGSIALIGFGIDSAIEGFASVIVMPVLGLAKARLAHRLGSAATKGEGNQNLLCAYLAAAVLVGLAGNALFGLWWLDPIAALVIAGVAVREGLETWRGEGCCAAPQLRGAERCHDDCYR